MDGLDIADALLVGRYIPKAKLRRIATCGDAADSLYVQLFEATTVTFAGQNVFKTIRAICAHQPTAEAWVQVVRYAGQPTGQNYARLVNAVQKMDDSAGTIMRLAPLALIRNHRRRFAQLVEHVAAAMPVLRSDLTQVAAELRQTPGPVCLQTRRTYSASPNVR